MARYFLRDFHGVQRQNPNAITANVLLGAGRNRFPYLGGVAALMLHEDGSAGESGHRADIAAAESGGAVERVLGTGQAVFVKPARIAG